jgi:1-phosphatidylinositol phosphodiesterase
MPATGDRAVVDKSKIDPRAWMAKLPDAASLYDLSIPGTHDTCALHGGDWPTTQTRTLAEQLEGGVRFIDIRCRHERDMFNIYHGVVDQHVEYGEGVQQVCLDFLAANPSETIIMSVKKEGDGGGNARTFQQVFAGYIQRRGCEAQWWLADTIPQLSDARGKIVLFRRFDSDTPGAALGLKPLPWPDDASFKVTNAAVFRVQDVWRAPNLADRDRKWDRVKALLDEAKQGDPAMFVNFCSATGAASHPRAMADHVNPRLIDFLSANPAGRIGAVLVDFETTDINRLIYGTNF